MKRSGSRLSMRLALASLGTVAAVGVVCAVGLVSLGNLSRDTRAAVSRELGLHRRGERVLGAAVPEGLRGRVHAHARSQAPGAARDEPRGVPGLDAARARIGDHRRCAPPAGDDGARVRGLPHHAAARGAGVRRRRRSPCEDHADAEPGPPGQDPRGVSRVRLARAPAGRGGAGRLGAVAAPARALARRARRSRARRRACWSVFSGRAGSRSRCTSCKFRSSRRPSARA